MHHNTIMTECITPETTPIIYSMFHTFDVRVKHKRIEITPTMMETLLALHEVQCIPESDAAVESQIEKMIPNAKYYGCLARESDNAINLWNDRITIYKPNRAFNRKELSQINWAAIGASDPEDTERFAKIMLEAVYIANKLNENYR